VKNALAIAAREIRSYFVSPVAYVVLTGFLLLSGWFFFNLLARFSYLLQIYSGLQRGGQEVERLNLNEFVISPLLHNLSVVLVILIPVITMRAFAEEKRLGTFELLLTSPLRVGEIVAGKFLGALAFITLMLGLTGIYPVLLVVYGNPESGIPLSRRRELLVDRASHLVSDREPDHRRGILPGRAVAPLRDQLAGRYVDADDRRGAPLPLGDRALQRIRQGSDRHPRARLLHLGDRRGAVPHTSLGRIAALEMSTSGRRSVRLRATDRRI